MENLKIKNVDKVSSQELFRLIVLVHGLALSDNSGISIPKKGDALPRLELLIGSGGNRRHTTGRVNIKSPIVFNKNFLIGIINSKKVEVPTIKHESFIGDTNNFTFSPVRVNGPSLVLDWRVFCCYKCKFCFKEADWEMRRINAIISKSPEENLREILDYLEKNAKSLYQYKTIWLCTGSNSAPEREIDEHATLIKKLREIGFKNGIFISMVIPKNILHDHKKRMETFRYLKKIGLDRFNSGMELVSPHFRRKYITGYKGSLTVEDYYKVLGDATTIFGKNVGSCVLIGLEPHKNSREGLRMLAEKGVQLVPTIYTSFVNFQLKNKIYGSIDDFIETNLWFKNLVEKYNMEIFESIFGLI
ncbi:MAG: hypothetical protein Athens101410_278 [Parcubacteria group bacterium Athens1014_10]|nr:MAG: hypothetical protein Athens101410_278 [Parcubacteria group bacterium Athens1014_10]TSD04983.1 MAG: hypothetical protein Athens071412_525 [Parcubacteria group bacterium Athens0714_12]